MYLVPEIPGNDYKHGPSNDGSNYSGYVPGSDVSASEAVESTENGAPSKAMLERFIKEVKVNTLYGGSGPRGKAMIPGMQKERWVQGPSGRFYSSNESECGKFHHSSFLAGRDVKAAGDWVVEQGKLKTISAMSGHYHPTLDSLRRALLDLQGVSRQLVNWGVVEVYKGKDEVKIPIRTFLDESAKDSKYLAQFTPFRA